MESLIDICPATCGQRLPITGGVNRRRLFAGLAACAATVAVAAPATAAEIYTPPVTDPTFVWPTIPPEWDASVPRGLPTTPRWTAAAETTVDCPASGTAGNATAAVTPAADQGAGFVRVQTAGTGGSWRGTALPATVSSGAPGPSFAGPVTFWRRADALSVAAPTSETVACAGTSRTTTFTYAARKPVGSTMLEVAGQSTGTGGWSFSGYNGDAASLESEIGFRIDDTWQYSLVVTARAGSVAVYHERRPERPKRPAPRPSTSARSARAPSTPR